jgi:8-oxo-dGTP diphosphatase
MKKFIIRAYGIWIQADKILISHETLQNFSFTKFPGGGVEHGEGIADALIREIFEETGAQLTQEEISHFYTTDFYQASAFNPEDQIVSVYYRIQSDTQPRFYKKDESTETKTHTLQTEWIPVKELTQERLTFPIDRVVAKLLQEKRK